MPVECWQLVARKLAALRLYSREAWEGEERPAICRRKARDGVPRSPLRSLLKGWARERAIRHGNDISEKRIDTANAIALSSVTGPKDGDGDLAHRGFHLMRRGAPEDG